LPVADEHLIGGACKVAAVGLALGGIGVAVEDFCGEGSGANSKAAGSHSGAGLLGGLALLLGAQAAAELKIAEGLAAKLAFDVGAFEVAGGLVAELLGVVADAAELGGLVFGGDELVGSAAGVGVVVAREAVGKFAYRSELEGFLFRVCLELRVDLVAELSLGRRAAL
jgi:hypothetical protein